MSERWVWPVLCLLCFVVGFLTCLAVIELLGSLAQGINPGAGQPTMVP